MNAGPSGPVVVHEGDDWVGDALAFGLREARLHDSTVLRSGAGVGALLDAHPDARVVVLPHRDVLHLINALTQEPAPSALSRVTPPIICMPAAWTPPPAGHRPVTVGIEFPERSEELLAQALDVARQHRTSLRVVHAWSFPHPYDDLILARVGATWDQQALREIDEALAGRESDTPVEVDVHHGSAPAAILHHAADSELVVLGLNRARGPGASRVGKVARTVLHGSSCPVLLLPSTSCVLPRVGPPTR